MKTFVLSLLVLGTFLGALVPEASAAAICTYADRLRGEYCPGVVCIGWTQQTGWQRCYVRIDDIPVPCRDYHCIDLP